MKESTPFGKEMYILMSERFKLIQNQRKKWSAAKSTCSSRFTTNIKEENRTYYYCNNRGNLDFKGGVKEPRCKYLTCPFLHPTKSYSIL